MAKFRKKPIVIEAVRWEKGQISELPMWIRTALNKNPKEEGCIMRVGNEVIVFTLEGEMTTSDGDYIIQGVNGEIYPCKPDIFEKTYEVVL